MLNQGQTELKKIFFNKSFIYFIFFMYYYLFKYLINSKNNNYLMQIKSNGDWGLGIGDWGLGIGPNPHLT